MDVAKLSTTSALFVFLKRNQLGFRISKRGDGYITASKSIAFDIGKSLDNSINYVALKYETATAMISFFFNGELKVKTSLSIVSSSNLLRLGTCSGRCGEDRDFKGKIYAFKWSRDLKSDEELSIMWKGLFIFYTVFKLYIYL